MFSRLGSLGGEQEHMGVRFVEGIVSVWVQYYFLLRCETHKYNRQRPCFSPSDFESVDLCSCYQFVCLCSLFCDFVCTCLCAWASLCVLAPCFVCCSCCDRWSTAHAQINRPTLMKSGFCLLSNSPSLSVPPSLHFVLLCHSLYFTALSLNRAQRDSERTLQNCNHPLEREAERDRMDMGRLQSKGFKKKEENEP